MKYPIDVEDMCKGYESLQIKCDDGVKHFLKICTSLINKSYSLGITCNEPVFCDVDKIRNEVFGLKEKSVSNTTVKLLNSQIKLMQNAYLQGQADAHKAKAPCGTGIPTESQLKY